VNAYHTLVLCYHAVSDRWNDPLAVTAAGFERQVRLALRGRRPGTAADAVASRRRTLVVTFDDAYSSVKRALPILERLGLRATVFACSGYGDGRPLSIPELTGPRAAPDGELATLTWDDLRELLERGHEVGSHTISHPHLTELDDAQLLTELIDSREQIEAELGRPCPYFAYPYGEQDARVRDAAYRAGYEAAFGLPGLFRSADPYALPRVGVYRGQSLLRVGIKLTRPARRLLAS
jgi:peptidoglycan/xylan/chitin deacetylase (PgdA/CDA1 family)